MPVVKWATVISSPACLLNLQSDTGQLNVLDAEFLFLKIHSNTVYILKLYYYYLKMWWFLSSEANRAGDDWHREQFVTHCSQEAHHATSQGATREAQGQTGGIGNPGKMWAGAFIVVAAGRNRQSRVSRLGICSFESYQWDLKHRDCPGCRVPGPGVMWAGG